MNDKSYTRCMFISESLPVYRDEIRVLVGRADMLDLGHQHFKNHARALSGTCCLSEIAIYFMDKAEDALCQRSHPPRQIVH